MEILGYDLAANQDRPAICFLLSQTVARPPGSPLESYVAVDPAITLTATPRNDRLCLDGFGFGIAYAITVKAGLPGVAGALPIDAKFRIMVPDRPPELGFAAPAAQILPRPGLAGVPIRSVNVPRIAVAAFRIPDRDLLGETPHGPLTGADASGSGPPWGEFVWRGVVTPKAEANRDSVTLLPLDPAIGALKPGLYVAAAWPDGAAIDASRPLATQYFQISDLGLSAYRGPDSLLVAIRSLSAGGPVAGVEVALIAQNNRELGRVRTDDSGFARFDPALLRGSGGDRPAAIYAYGSAGEFNRIVFAQPVLGPAGQPSASATDALIDLPRRDYRPGEIVPALIRLRNSQGGAFQKAPLTVRITRPDGAPFDRRVLNDQRAGGYALRFALPDHDAAGAWRIDAFQDDGPDPVGEAWFDVAADEDSDMTVSLTADAAVFDTAQPGTAAIEAHYAEGVAADMQGELQVVLQTADAPFPEFPEFSFGLADEHVAPVRTDPVRFTTDAAGHADLPLKPVASPRATKPLEAHIIATMFDAAGRTIDRTLDLPVSDRALLLGVRTVGGKTFSEGQPARFQAIAVSPDGARQEKPAAGWEILRRDPAPSWRWDGARFAYRSTLADSHVAGGAIDIPASAPAEITANLPAGRYRIEVFDPKGEAISSVEFSVGSAGPSNGDDPAAVEIRPSKPFYAAGESAGIFVKPPFDSDVLLVPAGRDAGAGVVQHVSASGGAVHFEFPRDAQSGVTLLVSAFAPPVSPGGAPRRALGTAWLAADPAPHRLDVALDVPAKSLPGQKLPIPVAVSGAGADPAFVSVTAAVDDDQDGLEDAAAPPAEPPAPSVSVYDVYDRIITPNGSSGAPNTGAAPEQRSSGTAGGARGGGSSVSSGIVALDKDGKGVVTLAVPDFAGKLRIKAIAWTASRQGDAERSVDIHQPVSIALPLPGFMTRDDRAELSLAVDNLDGPRGEYRVRVDADDASAFESVINLAEHEKRSFPVTVTAKGRGSMAIVISVTGPAGIAFDRRLAVAIQPGGQDVTRRASALLKPSATLSPDPALAAGLRPDSLAFSLVASASATFDPADAAHSLDVDDPASSEQPASCAQIVGSAMAAPAAAGRLGLATRRLSGWQNSDGGFGAAFSAESDLWTTALVADFLGRAKASPSAAPDAGLADAMLSRALDYLAQRALPLPPSGDPTGAPPRAIEAAAYAIKVLASNGRQTLFQTRYFASQFLPVAHSPLAGALVGAAFAVLGDKAAAAAAFADAGGLVVPAPDFRDQAALTAIMAENGAAPKLLAESAERLADAAAPHRRFSTEESIWVYRAAVSLPPPAGDIKLKVGDRTVSQSGAFVLTSKASDSGFPPIKNAGGAPVRINLAVRGVVGPDARDSAGYEVQRWFFDPAGKPIDPASLRLGDRMIVVLTGRFTGQGNPHALVTDRLAGGWRVEATRLADPANRFPWLKDLTGASFVRAADGGYMAVPILTGERREFKLAYVVVAATQGQFAVPGTVVEDIDQPGLLARLPAGRTRIDAAP
jgi:uncharacterized protein YfaS (alpha-2-macroglobulin family)